MAKPQVNHCDTVEDMLVELSRLCDEFNVTGIAITLSLDNGECITTHQVGMDSQELAISSVLMAEYATGVVSDHTRH